MPSTSAHALLAVGRLVVNVAASVVDGVGVELNEEEDMVTVLFAKEVCRGSTFALAKQAATKTHSFRLDILQEIQRTESVQRNDEKQTQRYVATEEDQRTWTREILLTHAHLLVVTETRCYTWQDPAPQCPVRRAVQSTALPAISGRIAIPVS